ncbi:MAG: UTP--glucose-1-phosphate uridylyltransferase [Gammaproteobacteria bacterium]|nr:UTP--glucose-1-phosphate uridylyltransferase [Gammaproteobacteria bacterium]
MSEVRVRTAVFPVAGLGTRFLPATKATPKEMLPIVDKPLVQYAVEEAVCAGAELLVFVTSRTKNAISDHFDRSYELERELEDRGDDEKLALLEGIVPESVHCVYIRQSHPLGLGHAIACAAPLLGKDPFYVLLADDLLYGEEQSGALLGTMKAIHARTAGPVLALESVEESEVSRYGIVDPETVDDSTVRVRRLQEKPRIEEAYSRLGVIGRYLLTFEVLEALQGLEPGVGGEIQLTDALSKAIARAPLHGTVFDGRRFDCGSKIGYLQACVEYGLTHDEVREEFRDYLGEKLRFLVDPKGR